jgi:hypothetical protein
MASLTPSAKAKLLLGAYPKMFDLPQIQEESSFVEFRRKVRSAEVLSPAVEKLLRSLHFTGRVSVVIQNGRVLKSGYEEGYFRQREPANT